jgi:hypothetical protein
MRSIIVSFLFGGLVVVNDAAGPECNDIMFGANLAAREKEKMKKKIYFIPTLKTEEERKKMKTAQSFLSLLKKRESNDVLVVSSNLYGSMATAYDVFGKDNQRDAKIYSISALNTNTGSTVGDNPTKDIEKFGVTIPLADARKMFNYMNVKSKWTDWTIKVRSNRFCKWLSNKSESNVIVFGHQGWLDDLKGLMTAAPIQSEPNMYVFYLEVDKTDNGCFN